MPDKAALLSLLLFLIRLLVHEFSLSSEISLKCKRNGSLEYQNKKKKMQLLLTG